MVSKSKVRRTWWANWFNLSATSCYFPSCFSLIFLLFASTPTKITPNSPLFRWPLLSSSSFDINHRMKHKKMLRKGLTSQGQQQVHHHQQQSSPSFTSTSSSIHSNGKNINSTLLLSSPLKSWTQSIFSIHIILCRRNVVLLFICWTKAIDSTPLTLSWLLLLERNLYHSFLLLLIHSSFYLTNSFANKIEYLWG